MSELKHKGFNAVKRQHSPTFLEASYPKKELLKTEAPSWAWETVAKAAGRSTLERYHVGAVILDPKMKSVVDMGWAHMGDSQMEEYHGVHAESHAMTRSRHLDLVDHHAIVWSENKNFTGLSWSSAPCNSCMKNLARVGMTSAIFPIRTKHGWEILNVNPAAALEEETDLDHPYAIGYRLANECEHNHGH